MAASDSEKSCNYTKKWANFTWLKVTYHSSDSTSQSSFEFFEAPKERLFYAYSEQSPNKFKLFFIPMVAAAYQDVKETGIKTYHECIPIVGDTYSIFESYAVKALYFLGRAENEGAIAINDKKTIKIKEEGPPTRIQVNPGDHMTMETPWELSGTIEKNADGDIKFNFIYSFYKNGKEIIAPITGSWSNRKTEIPIQDQEELSNWLVCISGDYKGGYEKSDFVPVVDDFSKLKTMKDLRKLTQ
ncbi:MAG: hypothetical protein KKC20_15310 [Proteobacteria bacterium]|nr:hypothetical protein [Pseudomonadota bacterium]